MNKTDKIRQFRKALQMIVEKEAFTEGQAKNISSIYPDWETDTAYVTGQYRNYDGNLYMCLIDHTSQDLWKPDVSPSLWKQVSFEVDGEDIIPVWVQPLAQVDAYRLNDIVLHNGKKWISIVDYNTWEPGVYGWNEYIA